MADKNTLELKCTFNPEAGSYKVDVDFNLPPAVLAQLVPVIAAKLLRDAYECDSLSDTAYAMGGMFIPTCRMMRTFQLKCLQEEASTEEEFAALVQRYEESSRRIADIVYSDKQTIH